MLQPYSHRKAMYVNIPQIYYDFIKDDALLFIKLPNSLYNYRLQTGLGI